ncbi:helix-turn-helix domain-containing protein [Zhongshania aliphaticivorans]|uniref:helix-turn-helix domain-containing protein n=1 Tax=Zhongshania aliphaticivorans TaxID=1470434 RepID=UPI0039C9B5FD
MSQEILTMFGCRLRQLRASRGMSQEELGALAGLDRTYISGVERGLRNLGLINLYKIAQALEVPADQLLVTDGTLRNE